MKRNDDGDKKSRVKKRERRSTDTKKPLSHF